jgi:tetratricopeptide (TPR) repeat protein
LEKWKSDADKNLRALSANSALLPRNRIENPTEVTMRPFWLLAIFTGCMASLSTMADEKKPQRFDAEVREDIFAGFKGDDEALQRGIKKCEDALAKNPKNAEALVWRGAGRVFYGGQLFGKQKIGEAMPLWTGGLKDLDKAVELEPDNIGVRIPRAAVLTQAGRNAPAAMGKPLLKKAREDFEAMYKKQEKEIAKIGTHPRGELHMGLADVYRQLGETDKSKAELETVVKEMANTKYAKVAKEWLEAKADAKLEHSCIGCHGK